MAETPSNSRSTKIHLGRRLQQGTEFGFTSSVQSQEPSKIVSYDGDGHLMTIAPTGKGKGVSAIIPTLLDYPGSVIVFDPKGENLQITKRRREELGQRVIVLNPFNVLTDQTDSLNPLDLLQLEGADTESDAQMLAQMISAENRFPRDPFWDNSACGILSGLIAHYGSIDDEENRTLNKIHQSFHSDDVVYNLAVMLDTIGKEMSPFAYQEIAAFLQHPEKETRRSVQSTAVSYLKCLAGGRVPDVLKSSSFSLQDFVDGEPVSIYIIIPPGKLESHRGLLRLFVATLLAAVLTREVRPELPTLFLLDEAAQLGRFTLLEQAVTLCRGYGLKVWSFWQDLSQLKDNYPLGWTSLINNCDIKQIFGISSMFMARDWATILEHSPRDLLKLGENEQLIIHPDGKEEIFEKFNYLTDPQFQGIFDPNPRFGHTSRLRNRPKLLKPREPKKEDKNEQDSPDENSPGL